MDAMRRNDAWCVPFLWGISGPFISTPSFSFSFVQEYILSNGIQAKEFPSDGAIQ